MLLTRPAMVIMLAACLLAAGGMLGISSSFANQPDYGGLRKTDPAERAKTVQEIRVAGDVEAVPLLLKQLSDPDVLVQRTAAEALAQIGTPQAVDSLVAALNSSQDSIIQVTMNALQELGEAAVTDLNEALRSNNPVVRKNAATALGYIKSTNAVAALKAATADPDADVAQEAAWALAEIEKRR